MVPDFVYTKEDFIYETRWNANDLSAFDEQLIAEWTLKREDDCFRYKLNIDGTKILPGKYCYLAQLNLDRAVLRRKPMAMQSMKQPFDPNSFNFTKIAETEILFRIVNKERKELGERESSDYLVINVSPLEFGHCLLLPALRDCLPQVVTADGLSATIQLFLLSKSPALRMGFNGLCAHASLNHLHFHLFYLQHQMLLETIRVKHLAGPCHVLLDFPSRGFVFQLVRGDDLHQFVRNVYKLVNLLQEQEKAHNLFITRGCGVQGDCTSDARDTVRLYVWARKPCYEAKSDAPFYPALCEMFGHLLVREADAYETLNEESVADIMSDLTTEPFEAVVDQVRQLFQDR